MDFRFDIIVEYAPYFWQGLLVTIGVSLAGIVFGLILGLFIGLGKMSSNPIIRLPFSWYINFFRGTPLVVQILLVHFGAMPLFFAQPNA
ncbi:ABC transporter permease subunit, partial [Bradyrhizobium yuanmingense]